MALNTEYPLPGDSPQTLAHSRCRYAFVAPHVAGRRVLDLGCGAGLGTGLLAAAGAREVVGLDQRSEALQLAREAQQRGTSCDWVQHDLETALPFADGRFDVVVALEVLEHVRAQQQLVEQIRRVLGAGGLAFVSVPHEPFESFWTGLAGESNPYHVHVPDRRELADLLSVFAAWQLSVQVDLVASLVLPLDDLDDPAANDPTEGSVLLPAAAPLSDEGTIVLIATACTSPGSLPPPATPAAHAWGNHQQSFGSGMRHNQQLDRYARTLLHERNAAQNRLRWITLGAQPPTTDD